MSEITKDGNGKESSKRWAGIILLITGGALVFGVGIAAIFVIVADPITALSAGKALIVTGAGLLGVGVIESVVKPNPVDSAK